MKISIEPSKHKQINFLGCSACDAKCCGSKIIFLTTADFISVANHFPIFFYIKDDEISLVYFFYYSTGQKCIYLKDNLCTIYNHRPHACKSYPFSYNHKNQKLSIDSDCPEFSEENGMSLISNSQANPQITKEYINPDMIKYAPHIYGETDEYVNLCMKYNLIAPFKDAYNSEVFNNFQPDFYENLYVAHQPKITIAMLKKKHIFENNRFKDFLKAQINSISNINNMV